MISAPYKIFWTDEAKYSIDHVISHLRKEWSEREINLFLDEVERVINLITIYPKLFKSTAKRHNVHMALIDSHTFLVYRSKANKKQIELLLFWGTRQNPKKNKYQI